MGIKEIYIKNFRNIGEEGAEIKLSPITIFTGCNSAGKSTAAKALLLLESYLSDLKANNYNLIDTSLDFSKVVKLGTFDSVLNNTAKSKGGKNIVLGYSFESAILNSDFKVRLTFEKKDTDALNNGYLKAMSIFIDSFELICLRIENGFYYIEVKDENKLIEYVRCYKIRQIVDAWKSHEIALHSDEVIGQQNHISDAIEIIRPIIPDILSIEENMVSEGYIKDKVKLDNKDERISVEVTIPLVRSAIEGIIDFCVWHDYVYNYEQSNKKRLEKDDIQYLLNEIYLNQNSEPKLTEEFKRQWKIISDGLDKELNRYVRSNARNIIEYSRNENSILIEWFVNSVNYHENQTDISHLGKGNIGLLDLIHYVKENNSGWIGRILEFIFQRCFQPSLCGMTGYVDASTVEVKRLYPLDYSDRFGNLWKRFNSMVLRRKLTSDDGIEHGSFMRKWLRDFGICEDVVVDNLEGVIRIKLFSKEIPEGRLLADYGYGVTQLVALLLNIEIAINNAVSFVVGLEDSDLAYAPIIGYDPYLLILEEPEVHLHPSLQSRLADMFLDASRYGVHFIIETHSEYLIRRTQVIVASVFSKNPNYIPSFRVYYFPENGKPYDMGYQTNGYFKESFGSGFLDEAGKWTRELMRTSRR